MKYEKVVRAKFISRENRFIATVQLLGSDTEGSHSCACSSETVDCSDEIVKAHVKNTGRCKELLVPGATVWLEDFEGRMGTRKMRYSLIAVCKENAGTSGEPLLINMDSQAPNKVVQEALQQSMRQDLNQSAEQTLHLPGLDGRITLIKPECTFGNSRFDFYIETAPNEESASNKAFIEVKGVTLEDHGFARFPDAPTERGIKHIHELIRAVQAGYKAYIVFVIQMKGITAFGPNYETHPAFGEALLHAKASGVNILAYDCTVTPDSLAIRQQFDEIRLQRDFNQERSSNKLA